MSRPFRIAFLGVDHPHGAHWRELLQNLPREIEIAALVPFYGGALASLEERSAELPRFETVEKLLAWREFEGAVVCLPNNEAPAAIAQLAAAGKHVLAEKPAGGSAEDGRRIVEAVRSGGIAFQAGYLWRFDEGAQRLRRMVQNGSFGKLISIEMSFVTSDAEHRGPSHYLFDSGISQGGFFNWLGCHFLDLLFYITGQKVVGVTARTGVFGATPLEVEDGGMAILDLAGGGIATFLGGYWLPRWAGESRWTLRGEHRWVHWDPRRAGTGGVLEIHGPMPQWHAMEETHVISPDATPGYGGQAGVALVQDWLQAARTGAVCRTTPETTAAVLELIDAIYRSSKEGRRIECELGANGRV